MKSDVIHVTNDGAGFDQALAQAEAVARFRDLDHRGALHLRLRCSRTGFRRAKTRMSCLAWTNVAEPT